MKKILLFILAISICLSLCACATYSAAVGEITNNDGTTEKFTPKDLCKINKKDSDKFEDLYMGAKIDLVGEVVDISSNTRIVSENMALTDEWFEITLLGGWVLTVTESAHPEVVKIKVGDNLHVESVISGCTKEYVHLGKSEYSNGKWQDETKISTVTIKK